MNNINLNQLSKLVSTRLSLEVEFTSIEQTGSGYHSDGFKLGTKQGKEYFLKYVRSHDLGFEYPERKISSLMVSTSMGKRAGAKPAPVGVIVLNGDHEILVPEISDSSKVYHLQEYGGVGKSYAEYLQENIHKPGIDNQDREQLAAIVDILTKIHSVKHVSTDKEHLKALYNDGIRNVLIHPELSIMALSEFPNDYPPLDLEGQKKLIGLMFEIVKEWIGRSDRLCALHGDFWGSNIFFRNDGSSFLVDYSRIPWGDPAIDVGWFLSELLWYHHETGNDYFKSLSDLWLDLYEQKSGDMEARKAVVLVLGWKGLVKLYPRWFPNLDVAVGKKYINHVMRILEQREFFWDI